MIKWRIARCTAQAHNVAVRFIALHRLLHFSDHFFSFWISIRCRDSFIFFHGDSGEQFIHSRKHKVKIRNTFGARSLCLCILFWASSGYTHTLLASHGTHGVVISLNSESNRQSNEFLFEIDEKWNVRWEEETSNRHSDVCVFILLSHTQHNDIQSVADNAPM